jgi:hypothetical protein
MPRSSPAKFRSRSSRPGKRAVRIAYIMWGVLGILVLTLGVLLGVTYVKEPLADHPDGQTNGSEEQDAQAKIEVERLREELRKVAQAAKDKQVDRQEAKRKVTEEVARQEAKRKAAEEVARQEAKRKAAEEVARKNAERMAKAAERKAAELLREELRKEADRNEAERKKLAAAELEARTWRKSDIYKLAVLIDELPETKASINIKRLCYRAMDRKTTETSGTKYYVMKAAAEACLAAYNEIVPKDKQKTLLDLKK